MNHYLFVISGTLFFSRKQIREIPIILKLKAENILSVFQPAALSFTLHQRLPYLYGIAKGAMM